MSVFLRKITNNNIKNILLRYEAQVIKVSRRKLSIVPSLYDGDTDPASKFFNPHVQTLLKRLTRPDFTKVFRKRTSSQLTVLKTPRYKFLTNDELEAEISKANQKADRLMQMPPAVKIQQPITEVISKDPALLGYDTSTYLFTDISFGVDNAHRLIVERDPDGTLRYCDHDVRKKLNQVYFPINGRKIREPRMFSNEWLFNSLLERQEYEFLLDRACIQYEPDEVNYQKITSITYQHVDSLKNYELLRSTRHFGPMVFFLTWHQSMDNLMLELLQNNAVRDAVLLLSLRQAIHADLSENTMETVVSKILPTPIQHTKPELLSEEDIELDTKCTECVAKYIKTKSAMKSQHELALQGFREYYRELADLSRGLKKAHGNA